MAETHYKKIVFIGNDGVGKTSLLERLQYGIFNPITSATIGASYVKLSVCVDGTNVNLHFWDTAGHQRFNVLLPMFIRGAKIVLVCFDLPDVNGVQKHIDDIHIIDPSNRIILVMTKIDQASRNDTKMMREYALNKELTIFLTSAKSGEGVQKLFEELARHFISLAALSPDALLDDEDAFELGDSKSSSLGMKSSFTQCCVTL